jgi:hypothetical protein
MAHSIAQYTGTRIDSSAKHIVACKVNGKVFEKLGNNVKQLTDDKFRYAMQKDELVLSVALMTDEDIMRGIDRTFQRTFVKHAYPPVITTLGDKLTNEHKDAIREYYRNLSFDNEDDGIVYDKNGVNHFFPFKFDFVGVSVGTAYASDLTGDPVGSVLIGGMMTVLNGHFPCYTGELVQWYFDFEAEEFDENGKRRLLPAPPNPAVRHDIRHPVQGREHWYQQRMFGAHADKNRGKQNMALIKPFRKLQNQRNYAYGDKVRVIGRIVNGGQPWEPIDIFLSNTFV